MTVNVADCVTPRVPEIVALPARNVLTVKLVVVCPAGTSTLEGTVATALLLLDRDTDMPVEGAGPFRTTVPVEVLPALTEVGFNVNDASCGGRIVRLALRVVPL